MKNLLALAFLLICYDSNAQNSIKSKRYNNWYFGDKAGVTFNTNPPSALTNGNINVTEGTAAISDKYGRLLFYTDGSTIWNACQDTMFNGSGLLGHSSSTQSALITPNPTDSNLYYVFVTGCTSCFVGNAPSFSYNIVDMCADNGRGAVISKNNLLLTGDSLSEQVAAVKHANGLDYWVVTRVYLGRTYYSFLVQNGILNPIPVVSHTGIDDGANIGYLKINESGDRLVSALSQKPTGEIGYLELGYFNNATGRVDSTKQLSSFKYNSFMLWLTKRPYAVEFSPNDSLVYASHLDSIFRYELYNSNPQSTETFIGISTGGGAYQLGPDGKIYTADHTFYPNSLSVINNPNNKSNPNYVRNVISLGAGAVKFGLPNTFYYYIDEDTSLVAPTDNLPYAGLLDSIFIDTCLGQAIQLGIPQKSCRAYAWLAPSLALDDTTLAEPIATKAGTYIVNVDYKCKFIDTVVLWTFDTIVTSISPDTTICPGTNIQLTASGGAAYQWSPGNSLNDSAIGNPLATPMDTTIYEVIIDGGNCLSDTQSVIINVLPEPIADAGTDTSICEGNTVILGASSSVSGTEYFWSPNTGLDNDTIANPTLTALINMEYIMSIMDSNSCTNSDTVYITVNNLPTVVLSGDSAICEGNTVQLQASGGTSYAWSPGMTLSDSMIANPMAIPLQSTSYMVYVSNQCGFDSASVYIDVAACDYYIPNAFTPNGDGFNDNFGVRGSGFKTFNLRIYDRWGNRVFDTKEQNEQWDGTIRKQTRANEGVYVYQFLATFEDGREVDEKGNIVLVN